MWKKKYRNITNSLLRNIFLVKNKKYPNFKLLQIKCYNVQLNWNLIKGTTWLLIWDRLIRHDFILPSTMCLIIQSLLFFIEIIFFSVKVYKTKHWLQNIFCRYTCAKYRLYMSSVIYFILIGSYRVWSQHEHKKLF